MVYVWGSGSGTFIPDTGSRIRLFFILDPGSIKEFKYFNPKIVSKLSEIWSALFIPDPDFLPLPKEVKRAPDPGSRCGNNGLGNILMVEERILWSCRPNQRAMWLIRIWSNPELSGRDYSGSNHLTKICIIFAKVAKFDLWKISYFLRKANLSTVSSVCF
jgi:hypothetical protein